MFTALVGILCCLAQDADATLEEKVERFHKAYLDSAARRAFEDGERLKAAEKFDDAIVRYMAAIRIKADYPQAAYQAACCYALSKRARDGLAWLAKAIELGFWGYGAMMADEDLDALRNTPEFAELAEKVEARYAIEAPKHPGGSILEKPQGAPPAAGWPVVLLLHGYGSNKEDFGDFAIEVAEQGFAGIAVSGPIAMGEGAYRWPEEIETTHKYLQEVAAKYRGDKGVDFKRLYVVGFSEGALHSLWLVAEYPETYLGALAISPGNAEFPRKVAAAAPPRPLYLVCGKNDPSQWMVKHAAAVWNAAKWPVKIQEHPGGHHFPEDWEHSFPAAVKWLTTGGK